MPHDSGSGEFRRIRSTPQRPQTPPSKRPARARSPVGIPPARVRRKRVSLLLAAGLSALVLLTSGSAWAITGLVSGQLNRDDVFGGLAPEERPDAGPRGAMTVLILGSDSREGLDSTERSELGVGNEEGARADTIMLAHLNSDRDHVSVVGIPRDSWVDIPGHGPNKINAAYFLGGPSLAVQTVESVTGVHIDHYVEVNFAGFVNVVDAVDGIEVCLPEALQDDRANLDMAAGTHHVTGTEALAFARTRATTDGDLDRIDRQQQVMAALLDRAISTDVLTEPTRLTGFLDTSLDSLTVDENLDTGTIRELSSQLGTFDLEDVTFTQVPLSDLNFQTPNGDVAVRWNDRAAAELFGQLRSDEPLSGTGDSGSGTDDTDEELAPSDVTLEVYNGIGTPGLGAQARAELNQAGFSLPDDAANWSTTSVEETMIRAAPQRTEAAELVQDAVPGSTTVTDESLDDRIQVVLGLNYTGVSAQARADAEPERQPEQQQRGRDEVNVNSAEENVCD
ncbi:LCP family protein [Lipingzhangella sp. LS1_29]|uniref:LCP family protein n=1 Tax=Lipingzhangella rawalii TaxID=2055835 RepID=A0ABU2H716_9ACTN|nr:LCP family protein [Lipingzhangella rawalii]MDS1270409.1 LCP family protein [Lipingzhangella rawalii]